jgi:hypothetical protein
LGLLARSLRVESTFFATISLSIVIGDDVHLEVEGMLVPEFVVDSSCNIDKGV